jgi:hypothetical protein
VPSGAARLGEGDPRGRLAVAHDDLGLIGVVLPVADEKLRIRPAEMR